MARADLSRSLAAEVTQHLFEMRAALAETVPAAEDVSHRDYEDTAGNAIPLDERFEYLDAFWRRWLARPAFNVAYADRSSGVPAIDNRT